jgi:RluA family pseudouridine synthase
LKKPIFRDLILLEEDDYLLINKPAGISTLEDRNDTVNLLGLAREYHGDAQVAHRLDKDTTGVLAIAKNPEAYRNLAVQFEKREVKKLYHTVVDGLHDFRDQLVDLPILKKEDGLVEINRRGKPAQTWLSSLEAYRNHTLVECRPNTGRTHQIRIHLASFGAPITGDKDYGGKPFFLSSIKKGFNLKKDTDEMPLMKRMALHAFGLEFRDLGGNLLRAEAPYPKDFHALVRQLRANAKR